MIASTEKSMLSQLKEMEIGDILSFPISKMSYIKGSCSNFGLEWGVRFSTSINREQKTIDVTREE